LHSGFIFIEKPIIVEGIANIVIAIQADIGISNIGSDRYNQITGSAAGSTLENMNALIASANELMANDRNTTMLNQVTDTLAALESLALSFSAESRTSQEMQSTLNAITDLMNEFRPLAVELKNKPNSLIFPAATQPELVPTRKLP